MIALLLAAALVGHQVPVIGAMPLPNPVDAVIPQGRTVQSGGVTFGKPMQGVTYPALPVGSRWLEVRDDKGNLMLKLYLPPDTYRVCVGVGCVP